ncbi:hypothetical protein, conserved [Angomonas deanei]|uniref:Uncharacterized protein n=1 Tax=Angomonas deanei TaxID=59799 RepID=A0A7G2CKH9_9TRYP|nr:hypothetical protein, conserved [Angomonas deanei]
MQQEEEVEEEETTRKQQPPPHASTPPAPQALSSSRSASNINGSSSGQHGVAEEEKEVQVFAEKKNSRSQNNVNSIMNNNHLNSSVSIKEPAKAPGGILNSNTSLSKSQTKGAKASMKPSTNVSLGGNSRSGKKGFSTATGSTKGNYILQEDEYSEDDDDAPPTEEELLALAEELAETGEAPMEFQRLRKEYRRPCRHEEAPEGLCLNNNSHTNRMEKGSYSRFLLSQDYVDPSTNDRQRTFAGERNFCGTVPIQVDYKQNIHEKMRMTEDELADEEEGWSASSRGLSHRKRYSIHDNDGARLFTHTAQEVRNWGQSSKGQSTFLLSATSMKIEGADDDVPPQTLSHPHHNFGASSMKREAELLDDETYQELCRQRERRKRLPHHCKPIRKERDYVYYNSNSKGFYVPHDHAPTATMLNYNHLYDFGDGTRMGAGNNNSTKRAVPVVERDGTVKEYNDSRRNPTAQGPLAYHETTRGAAAYDPKYWGNTHRQNVMNASSAGGTATMSATRANKSREDIKNQSSSLSTAKALRVKDIHISQSKKNMRTIEDVMAQNPNQLKADMGELQKGNDTSTVDDTGIMGACKEGKLNWDSMPKTLQGAVEEASSKKEERNQLRGSTNSGNAANTGRATSATLPTIGGNASNNNNNGSGSAPYKVSRLNYKKEYTKESNPSAFVR